MRSQIFLIFSSLLFLYSCGDKKKSVGEMKFNRGEIVAIKKKLWKPKKAGRAVNLVVTFIDSDNQIERAIDKIFEQSSRPEGFTPKALKKQVEMAAKEWSKYGNIKFEFYSSPKKVPSYKSSDIRITFALKGGNFSNVGSDASYVDKRRHTMSFSSLSPDLVARYGTIMHEFGHALGLSHEHQSPDRKFKIDKYKAIEWCRKEQGWDRKKCENNILETVDDQRGVSAKDIFIHRSGYDKYSIMHYTLHPGFLDTRSKKDLQYFKKNSSLSLTDKLGISELYPKWRTSQGKKDFQAKIVSSHKRKKASVSRQEFGNCKVIGEMFNDDDPGQTSGVPPLKKYSFSSKAPGEYTYPYWNDDIEGVIGAMEKTDYCNLDKSGLDGFRNKRVQKYKTLQNYINCWIPIPELGEGSNTGCSKEFPYYIERKDNKKLVNRACYPSFEAARKAAETKDDTKYCRLKGSALSSFTKNEKDQLAKASVLNDCSVKNFGQEHGCPPGAGFQIIRTSVGLMANRSCYGSANHAISEMKKIKYCGLSGPALAKYKEDHNETLLHKGIMNDCRIAKGEGCSDEFPYVIEKISLPGNATRSCYPSVESVKGKLGQTEYCLMKGSELKAHIQSEKAKLNQRKFGKCEILGPKLDRGLGVRCPPSAPYIIVKDSFGKKRVVGGSCFQRISHAGDRIRAGKVSECR